VTRWRTDNLPPGVTAGSRPPSAWRDGLLWSIAFVLALGLLVGIAIGKVIYG